MRVLTMKWGRTVLDDAHHDPSPVRQVGHLPGRCRLTGRRQRRSLATRCRKCDETQLALDPRAPDVQAKNRPPSMMIMRIASFTCGRVVGELLPTDAVPARRTPTECVLRRGRPAAVMSGKSGRLALASRSGLGLQEEPQGRNSHIRDGYYVDCRRRPDINRSSTSERAKRSRKRPLGRRPVWLSRSDPASRQRHRSERQSPLDSDADTKDTGGRVLPAWRQAGTARGC